MSRNAKAKSQMREDNLIRRCKELDSENEKLKTRCERAERFWKSEEAEANELSEQVYSLKDESARLLGILQECYDEHMHFGWGYEELHDKIISTLGDRLKPAQEIIDFSMPIGDEERAMLCALATKASAERSRPIMTLKEIMDAEQSTPQI